jgi:hypothetical protein
MSKRIPFVGLTTGIALLFLVILVSALKPVEMETAVVAALPPDHPPVNGIANGVPLTRPLPITQNDLFLSGTQPNQMVDTIPDPESCRDCHENITDIGVEQPEEYAPWIGWQGSMMAQAGRDPVFFAALDIANADAIGGGEFCLRCHMPRGWLHGRSTPSDGSAMTLEDREGVQCEVCHRMVDPVYEAGISPSRDITVHNTITSPVTTIGSGSLIMDPEDYRRGPFDIVTDLGSDPHSVHDGARGTLQSPYHQEANFCGSCHDINNPLLSWDEARGEYWPNDMDAPAPDLDELFPIERTFTEWQLSDYNTPEGVYAPKFGGNKTAVSTCQDCHMRDVTGVAGDVFGEHIQRDDMPLHDLTGANTWVPQIIPQHPVFSATFQAEPERVEALQAGIERARYMLQNAATVTAVRQDDDLLVTVVNESGHKLPTGYVEGRRMWLQVEGYNAAGDLIFASGTYTEATGELEGYHQTGSDLKVYESLHGLTPDYAAELGLSAGHSFHFILNNDIVFDNRIPPRGFEFNAYAAAGAAPYTNSAPDPTLYGDGQYWDTTTYQLPPEVVTGTVRLMHQVAAKEYVEFLRDNSPTVGSLDSNGEILFALWEATERSKPEVMSEVPILNNHVYLPMILKQE